MKQSLLDPEDRATADPAEESASAAASNGAAGEKNGRSRNSLSRRQCRRLEDWLDERRDARFEDPYAASAADASVELQFAVTPANVVAAREALDWPSLTEIRRQAKEEAEPKTLEERLEAKLDDLDGKVRAILRTQAAIGQRLDTIDAALKLLH